MKLGLADASNAHITRSSASTDRFSGVMRAHFSSAHSRASCCHSHRSSSSRVHSQALYVGCACNMSSFVCGIAFNRSSSVCGVCVRQGQPKRLGPRHVARSKSKRGAWQACQSRNAVMNQRGRPLPGTPPPSQCSLRAGRSLKWTFSPTNPPSNSVAGLQAVLFPGPPPSRANVPCMLDAL
eukprot:366281-Chlamydomonas_euryale.AAC.2